MKVYITRHGETAWNQEGRMQGQLNSNLTSLGCSQAEWLGDYLKDSSIDIICSSTSGRAIQTAEKIKGTRAIEISTYDDLREINLGDWEGMLHEDIAKDFPEAYNNLWHHPEKFNEDGKETTTQITKRAGLVLEDIIKQYQGSDVLIVAHALLLKGMFSYIKGLKPSEFWSGPYMKSTCLSIIEVNETGYEFILEGDTSHYKL